LNPFIWGKSMEVSVVSGKISNPVNYEIEIAKFLKAKKKALHYKEINEFYLF